MLNFNLTFFALTRVHLPVKHTQKARRTMPRRIINPHQLLVVVGVCLASTFVTISAEPINYSHAEMTKRESAKNVNRSVSNNEVEEQFKTGLRYYMGNGVKKDAKKAVEWLLKAAGKNHAEAQFVLGRCYAGGDGVERDAKKAAGLFRKAAENGHADA